MRESTFTLERELYSKGYRCIAGIDEAGRGPLAGPVVAAAVILKNLESESESALIKIKDSKALSKNQREKLERVVREYFYVGVGICDHKTIDRINILQSSFLAMKKALTELRNEFFSQHKGPGIWNPILLVDGNKKIPAITWEQYAIVQGDQVVKSISAASIIAKVTRDNIMQKMAKIYPDYLFNQHKGYGTVLHMELLKKYGPCEIHRKSFQPVALAKKQKCANI